MTAILLILSYGVGLMLLGYLTNRLMTPIFGMWWRVFVAPGVILHELAHALACVLVGAPVHEINFWKISGGHVIHGQPRIHIVGPVLISFAPMIFMSIALVLAAPLFSSELLNYGWFTTPPAHFWEGMTGYFPAVWEVIRTFAWFNPMTWFMLYLALNVAATIAPSGMDLRNARWAFVALILLVILAVWLFDLSLPLSVIWPVLAPSAVFLGIAFAGVCILRLVLQSVRSAR